MKKILINKVQCKRCKDIIQSKHCHDFVRCSCWNGKRGVTVDGGTDYLKRCGSFEDFTELSEFGDPNLPEDIQ